jgi:GT2 family glycosyltransferase
MELAGGARYLLLLTQDVHLEQGCVEALVERAEASPEHGLLGPVLQGPADGDPFSYGGEILSDGSVRHRSTPPSAIRGIANCSWLDGSVLLLRADAAAQVGHFDAKLFMYFEDVEYCLRLRRAGWKVGIVTQAIARQEPGQVRRPAAYSYLQVRNGLEYAKAEGGGSAVARRCRGVLRELIGNGRVAASPRSSREQRQVARRRLAGALLGLRDFALRRFGPPPSLPGPSDIQGL